jgi:hypothetical protein
VRLGRHGHPPFLLHVVGIRVVFDGYLGGGRVPRDQLNALVPAAEGLDAQRGTLAHFAGETRHQFTDTSTHRDEYGSSWRPGDECGASRVAEGLSLDQNNGRPEQCGSSVSGWINRWCACCIWSLFRSTGGVVRDGIAKSM